MSDFENLVRPFQSGDTTPSQTFYAPGDPANPYITLRMGHGGGGGKILNGSNSATSSSYCKRYENEKKDGG